MSAGAIYRYFPAKEDIVAAIAAEHHRREGDVLARAEGMADIGALLRELAQVSIGRLAEPDEQRWSCGASRCAMTVSWRPSAAASTSR